MQLQTFDPGVYISGANFFYLGHIDMHIPPQNNHLRDLLTSPTCHAHELFTNFEVCLPHEHACNLVL